jgi:membrane fusion protein (multidrug efflux system)
MTEANSKKKNIVIAVVSGALMVVGYLTYYSLFYLTTDNAQIQGKTVMLSARVSGYVSKVNVIENQKVKAGDVLAEIDSRDYENYSVQIENEMSSQEARVKDAGLNERRLSELYKKGAVSLQQYDTSEATANELRRKLKALQSQVSQARLNLDYTKIKAPSDGVIARKSAEIGMLASVGTPLFGFVSSDERWVVANFKETEMSHVRAGEAVDVYVDAIPGKVFRGTVQSKSAATGATFTLLPPDNATGNFTKVVQRVPVRIGLDGLSAQDVDDLQAGLSAFVKVRIR